MYYFNIKCVYKIIYENPDKISLFNCYTSILFTIQGSTKRSNFKFWVVKRRFVLQWLLKIVRLNFLVYIGA